MSSMKMTVKGDDALIRTLNQLPYKAARRSVRAGLSKGGSVMSKAAKKNVPTNIEIVLTDKDGKTREVNIGKDLRRSIGHRAWTPRGKKTLLARVVGPRYMHVGKDTGLRPSQFAYDVEYGTEHRSPIPFMRKAYDGAKSQTLSAVQMGIQKKMAAEISKLRVSP